MRYKKPSVSCPKTNEDGLKKNSLNKFNGGVNLNDDEFMDIDDDEEEMDIDQSMPTATK